MARGLVCRNHALALLLVFAVATVACSNRDEDPLVAAAGSPTQTAAAATATPLSDADIDQLVVEAIEASHDAFPFDLADGYALGDPDAPLTITVHEDFQCPHCLDYTATVEPNLIAEYVVSGQVRILFRHFPILGAESVAAAIAAECAARQDRFWEMHFELFLVEARAGQFTGEKTNVGRFSDAALADLADTVGLDPTEFATCYAADDTLETVAGDASAARAAGLTGTPGVLFNGVPVGGNPGSLANWRLLIDSALADLDSED